MMKFTSKQIKNIAPLAQLALQNNINETGGRITSMATLLNILHGYQVLNKEDIELPLSQADQDDLMKQIKILPKNFVFNLDKHIKNETNAGRYRSYREYGINNEVVYSFGGKNYAVRGINQFIGATRSSAIYPEFRIHKWQDKLVQIDYRLHGFYFDKNGYHKDKNVSMIFSFYTDLDSASRDIIQALRSMSNYIGSEFPFLKDIISGYVDSNKVIPIMKQICEQWIELKSQDASFYLQDLLSDFYDNPDYKGADIMYHDFLDKHPNILTLLDKNRQELENLPENATIVFNAYRDFDSLAELLNDKYDSQFQTINKGTASFDPKHNLYLATAIVLECGNSVLGFNEIDNDYQIGGYLFAQLSNQETEKFKTITFLLILNELLHYKIDLAKCQADKIFKLIYLQQEELDYKVSSTATQELYQNAQLQKLRKSFSPAFLTFMAHFLINVDTKDTTILVKDLYNYLLDLAEHKPLNNQIFNLVAGSIAESGNSDTELVNLKQANALKLNNVLYTISENDKKKVYQLFPRELQTNITNVFGIHDSTDLKCFTNIAHNLVHGTKSDSIFSILYSGLLDSDTLAKQNNQHYEYTGSGLGVGIYFARSKQSQKSLNYASSTGYNAPVYLFVCDVGYDKKIVTHNYGDNRLTKTTNLVVGTGVGSFGRDEIVARNGQQVRMKYLIEFNKYDN